MTQKLDHYNQTAYYSIRDGFALLEATNPIEAKELAESLNISASKVQVFDHTSHKQSDVVWIPLYSYSEFGAVQVKSITPKMARKIFSTMKGFDKK